MVEYLPILVLFVVSTAFVAGSFLASGLLGSKRRANAAKLAPYECGIVPENEPADRFPVKFYLVAMIFIIVDIEIIFLYPWAVQYDVLGAFGLIEMVVFSVAVFVSLAYMISNGALDWGPVSKLRLLEERAEAMLRADRTTGSTIKRVPAGSAGEPLRPAAAVETDPTRTTPGEAA